MRFSPYSRIIQQGIRAANYGVLPDYTDVLLDPVQKAMAEVKYGAKGTHELLKKFRQRDEPPRAYYEMKNFSPFETTPNLLLGRNNLNFPLNAI